MSRREGRERTRPSFLLDSQRKTVEALSAQKKNKSERREAEEGEEEEREVDQRGNKRCQEGRRRREE